MANTANPHAKIAHTESTANLPKPALQHRYVAKQVSVIFTFNAFPDGKALKVNIVIA